MTPSRIDSKIPALDGVRGLAIALVFVAHLCPGLVDDAGWSGVDLFFVLSGFLITGVLADGAEHPNRARTFYTRRALRIFPLYYATLLAVLIAAPAFRWPLFSVLPRHAPTVRSITHELAWYWPYLANWSIGLLRPHHPGPLAHFWSLAVEEQFYLVWPLVVWRASRRGAMRVAIGALVGSVALRVALVIAGAPYLTTYVLTPCRLDGLAIGAIIALLVRRPAGVAGARRVVMPLAGAGALALVGLALTRPSLTNQDPWVQTVGFVAFGWVYGGLVVMALAFAPATLTWAPLRWVGVRSYGLYVLHPFVIFALATYTSIDPGTLAFSAVTLTTSAAVAALSYRYFERPLLGLKDRLAPAYQQSTVRRKTTRHGNCSGRDVASPYVASR